MITKSFIFCFLIIYFILNTLFGIYLIVWNDTISIIFFILLSIGNIEFAFSFTELIFTLMLKKKDLPYLEILNHYPEVALLYVTCNDYFYKSIESLSCQSYKNYDIFILDDSDEIKYQNDLDEFGFKIIRRGTRKGNKAGNLNNWLKIYGSKYKYFLVVDSDSLLPVSFLDNIIGYAEHPDNTQVALFQSKISIWNLNNTFPKIMSTCIPIQILIWERILSSTNMIPLGNNCLYRTESILKIGGFIEEFAAEDLATGIELIGNNYECKLVDVISYETIPESLKSYSKRSIRWSTQTIEILLKKEVKVPLLMKFYILSHAYKALAWFNIMILMILAVWSYSSTTSDLTYFIFLFTTLEVKDTQIFNAVIIISLYWLYYLTNRIPLVIKSKISIIQFYKYVLLNLAMEIYGLFPLLKAVIKVLSGIKVKFTVTDKRVINKGFLQIVGEMKFSLIFLCFLLLGLIRNPVSLLFNFTWLIPFLISPVVLFFAQKNNFLKKETFYEK
ncbi:MAG: bcsA [Ignavibacteria bacterium]|nr:bcsA [Ignavibacteria bacterium]